MTLVDYAFADGLARITLADPERGNALSAELGADLLAAVRRARQDGARVVLLAARGTAFSVGGDVKAFAAAAELPSLVEDLAEDLHRAVTDLQRSDAIVVSVVQGVAAGAGVPLAAAADLVLAGESAAFTLAYTRIGFSPDGGSTLLPATVGLHRALHLALLNPRWSAAEAHAAGLVAKVFPDDELAAGAEAVVAQLLAGPAAAQAAAKRLIRDAVPGSPETAMRRESLSIAARAGEPDAAEGLAAFVGKRRPVFPSTLPDGA
ncbi:enoyl-CoA hydratase-related protein [Kineosporia sp. A_224]|uniref:enoyl-CoA hydratase-related protein n=1 Tax=Kineosporia sp. A_224 TaxID=1962180 RepID=UPI000B4AAB95|nr:enoyl-CoA hydratase-related protein [Kineosporia sp. A_224]